MCMDTCVKVFMCVMCESVIERACECGACVKD